MAVRTIAVIGATGKLAIPVIKELVKSFQVRAIARLPEKASALLPASVEIVQGDLKDPISLINGLKGVDAVYLNLTTETIDLGLPFYEEREGVRNVVEAAKKNDVQYIAKIGALGAYPYTKPTSKNVTPNLIRIEGHKFIEDSGINFTIFDPSFFMDSLPWTIRNGALQWIGNGKGKFFWISSYDYASQVLNAFNNPKAINRHYAIQGLEPLDPFEAMERFAKVYDPSLTIQSAPLWIIRGIGIFNPKMRFLAHMFAYFEKTNDTFLAEETWRDLGKPNDTIEDFARKLRAG